jgi:WXG100 family type VII secretion target
MAKSITVQPEKLRSTAGEISGHAGEYQKLYKQLYTEVETMGQAWAGEDNLAYVTQIKGFTDDFERMQKLMTDYAEFLKKAAETYNAQQGDVVTKAKTLSTGN